MDSALLDGAGLAGVPPVKSRPDMEQETGFEPVLSAWKAEVLAVKHYSCMPVVENLYFVLVADHRLAFQRSAHKAAHGASLIVISNQQGFSGSPSGERRDSNPQPSRSQRDTLAS